MKRFEPQNRAGIWYLIRRVPKALKHLDQRTFVKLTTGIRVDDDPRGVRARRAVIALSALLEEQWADLAAGKDPTQARAFDRAQITAANMGLPYLTAKELAAGHAAEIMRRLELLEEKGLGDNSRVVRAVLGAEDRPPFMLADVFDHFKEEQAASLRDMSPTQLRQWEMNKKRAMRIALEAIGNKPVLELTREDGVKFRKWYQKRIVAGELAIKTANIEMSHFIKMLKTIEAESHMGVPLAAFERLRIEGGKSQQRPAFDLDFIQQRILATGALDGLDPEARRIVLVMADTGMRPAEVVNLRATNIRLDADVPHVAIRGEGRRLKTDPSERDMPLVGCALAAMRLQPDGFPTYFDKSDDLCEVVNKYLSTNELRQTPRHTLYGLRHSFEDRLTALDPPDKIIGRFMGHKQYREKYGKGPTLEHLHSWISRIALVPPASI